MDVDEKINEIHELVAKHFGEEPTFVVGIMTKYADGSIDNIHVCAGGTPPDIGAVFFCTKHMLTKNEDVDEGLEMIDRLAVWSKSIQNESDN